MPEKLAIDRVDFRIAHDRQADFRRRKPLVLQNSTNDPFQEIGFDE